MTYYVHPTAILVGDVEIGDGAYIGAYAVIGTPPEHGTQRYAATGWVHGSRVVIGAGTEIREHVTIHAPMAVDGVTSIGARCIVMTKAHVGHDSVIGDDVKVASGALLGGHTRVHEGANLGLGAITHQLTTIGAYAMVGMGAVVTHDVPPAALVHGAPARWRGVNRVGLQRAGYDAEAIATYYADTRADADIVAPPHLGAWWGAFLRDARRSQLTQAPA